MEKQTSPEKPLEEQKLLERPKIPTEDEFPPPPGTDNQDHKDIHADDTPDAVFNESDIQNLWDIFNLFDKEQAGAIGPNDLEAILTSLKRNPDEAQNMLS